MVFYFNGFGGVVFMWFVDWGVFKVIVDFILYEFIC